MARSRRPSSIVLAAGLAIAIAALALTLYTSGVRRSFSQPTATTMGTVTSHSGSKAGRRAEPGMTCWVAYEFTPAEGGPRRSGWGMWTDACGVKTGAPLPVQYVIANPDVNRPPDGGPPISPLVLWFVAGVVLVIGWKVRDSGDGGES